MAKLADEQIARIIYEAVHQFDLVTDPGTAWESFDNLPEPIRALEVSQIAAIIANPRLKPSELHEQWKVTTQAGLADGSLNQNLVARLNPYMIPFRGLATALKTRFRLQLQLARTIIRHNRNVERDQKRQRQR